MKRLSFPPSRGWRWLAAVAAAAMLGAGATAAWRGPEPLESMWYLVDSEDGVQAFLRHSAQVSIVAPLTYTVDSAGALRGDVDRRVMRAAREAGVRVMPLVRQPDFDQAQLARLLRDSTARARAARDIAQTCRDRRYWGFQVDFENVRVHDGPLLTAFYRQIAGALHAAGCRASIAVVPRVSDSPGESPYQYWMYGHWRGAYDYAALAAASDFITLMSYDQHSRHTPPGPVAGMPWVEATLDFVIAQGVPPEKILLGVPAYSRHWLSAYDGGHEVNPDARARGLGYAEARALAGEHGASMIWDRRQKVYRAAFDREATLEYIFFENARTFRHKVDFASRRGVRGIAVWRLGQEDPQIWNVVKRTRAGASPSAAPE